MIIKFLLLLLFYGDISTAEDKALKRINNIVEVLPKHPEGTVVFLHGIGDTGLGLKRWIDALMGKTELFYKLHVIFPTSAEIYSKKQRRKNHAWYREEYYTYNGKEDLAEIDCIANDVIEILKNESRFGIPMENIFIGGFGMGGNVAMHIGFRYATKIAGVFCLSCFLKRYSVVFRVVKERLKRDERFHFPELFMVMGENDRELPPDWIIKTSKRLKRVGIRGNLFTMLRGNHELQKNELLHLEKWIFSKLGSNILNEFN
ncbi:lysophospholipase-like protein 1 [Lycorma delicatula]|uniref:lysophospholipase-like protein 1 n=1 Tax=Lycorma delicatula TaxID=130591 RepID=UPI003F510834